MTRYAVVPRETEVLVRIVGLLAKLEPGDRLQMAWAWRLEAIEEGEVRDLPTPAALVWLAGFLERAGRPRGAEPKPSEEDRLCA